jgi:hypothetical protein
MVPLAPAVVEGAMHNATGDGGGLVPTADDAGGAGEAGIAARAAAEDRSGATMGQLGDTNVEPESVRQAAGDPDDQDADGYWQIG